MSRGILPILLSVSLLGSLLPALDHVYQTGPFGDRSGWEGDADADCSRVIAYVNVLDEVLASHDTFMGWWSTSAGDSMGETQQIPPRGATAIVEDGQEMLAALESIEPPEPYEDGHAGIILWFGWQLQFVSFLALDASIAPPYGEQDDAIALLYWGETSLAAACPDEIETAGGFIFVDPEWIEDQVDP